MGDLPYGADQDVSKQQCDGVHGQLMKQSQWMVHVWTVPGYESSLGTFSHLNPAITCKDGTYYSMPLSSNIGTRASLCFAIRREDRTETPGMGAGCCD